MLNLLRLIGFNRAVGYGVLARVWGLISGPVTMLIVVARFSREQQGFFYTISSLLALQIFFELGLMVVLAQFASHEFAHLRWGERGRIEGDPLHRQRFVDLMCKSAKWFGIAAIMLIVGLIPAGLIFLSQGDASSSDFAWKMPWVLAVLGTGLNLMVVPFFAFILGSGDVVAVNQREMAGGIIGACLSWIVIVFGGGLFAVFAVNLGNIVIAWIYLLKHKPEFLKIIWNGIFGQRRHATECGGISWWGEVWPMQWKIAVSWISGYFIFQLFNPVLFYYHGAVVAGQMGMTLSAANGLMAVGMTWLYAQSPEFGKLIAAREWLRLDKLFARVLSQAFAVALIGAIIGWGAIHLLQKYSSIGQRFLPAGQVAFLLAAVCVQLITSGLAVYLRAHKQEPFLGLSIFNAVLQGTATWWLGMKFSSQGVALSVFVVSLLTAFPALFIWRKCRKDWHSLNVSK